MNFGSQAIDFGIASIATHSILKMTAHQVSAPLYEEAIGSFKRALDSLATTVDAIDGQMRKSTHVLHDAVSTKTLLQSRLSQAESRLKAALDDLSIERNSKQDFSSLVERLTQLQQEVRSKRLFSWLPIPYFTILTEP